jgi:hypothetical protein
VTPGALVRAVEAGAYAGRLGCKSHACPGRVEWRADRRCYRCTACGSAYSYETVTYCVARWIDIQERAVPGEA